jgi:phage N-6-adenine-methyltransferase
MDTQLTLIEQDELKECEIVIERGLQTFYEVGEALLRIRDKRLYRCNYDTFESYCQLHWNLEYRRAKAFMDASIIIKNIEQKKSDPVDHILPLPEYERQVRPLTVLKTPEEQREAWQRAIETAPNGRITGPHVQSIVNEMLGKSTPDKMQVHYSSESEQWNTPQLIIDRVLKVMRTIELDPCSNSHDNPNIPAQCVYTEEDNGLSHAWFGTVYMNPPYGDVIKEWVEKLASDYEDGHLQEAIALLPARTDTQWFRRLRDYPRCFVWGRLRFSDATNSAPFPSMVVYLGENVETFTDIFSDIGDVYIVY